MSRALRADLDDTESETARRLLTRLFAYRADLGISRVSDITGLDRIGIPVVQVVRPLSLVNAVAQGKGMTQAAAAVSAIMEAGEQAFSERPEAFTTTLSSAHALGVNDSLYDAHMGPEAPRAWASMDTAWLPATDMLSGRPSWLPFELVHCAYTNPSISTDGWFLGSTSGLACGFDDGRALLHSLLECIERDAIARAQLTHGFFQKYRIDEASIDHDRIVGVIRRVNDAGCMVAFWLAPAVGRIPVIWCQIMEDGRQAGILPYPADGFAAALDPASAALAALLEAAQSRLAAISGARDDITRTAFPTRVDWAAVARHRRFLADSPRILKFGALPGHGRECDADPLGHALERLAGAGIATALSVRLPTQPCSEIVAVRIVVPQLLPLREA